jgi:hypothetical protein
VGGGGWSAGSIPKMLKIFSCCNFCNSCVDSVEPIGLTTLLLWLAPGFGHDPLKMTGRPPDDEKQHSAFAMSLLKSKSRFLLLKLAARTHFRFHSAMGHAINIFFKIEDKVILCSYFIIQSNLFLNFSFA